MDLFSDPSLENSGSVVLILENKETGNFQKGLRFHPVLSPVLLPISFLPCHSLSAGFKYVLLLPSQQQ